MISKVCSKEELNQHAKTQLERLREYCALHTVKETNNMNNIYIIDRSNRYDMFNRDLYDYIYVSLHNVSIGSVTEDKLKYLLIKYYNINGFEDIKFPFQFRNMYGSFIMYDDYNCQFLDVRKKLIEFSLDIDENFDRFEKWEDE